MSGNIGDNLDSARYRHLVGRDEEIALFRSALEATSLPFSVLYLFGPGGVGKTTLLRTFSVACRQVQIPAYGVDGRNMETTPEGFLRALQGALGLSSAKDVLAALADPACRRVLMVDTFETLEPLHGWIRDSFLPPLGGNTLVVLAGRTQPPVAWRADPGWQTIIHPLSLRNFSPDDSRAYLQRRLVPEGHYPAILRFTHGHPLALSLVADVLDQRGSIGFEPEAAPDVIQALLERFAQKVPTPAHQEALEICALVRLTTEPLLAHTMSTAPAEAREMFDWLRSLSFIESGWRGVFPHDLAREALLADLRWRNPDRYAELHLRARAYYGVRLKETKGLEQQRILFDYVFLHRDSVVVRTAFAWQDSNSLVTDELREMDYPALVAMTERQEGSESARLLEHWLARQPEGTLVFREAQANEEIADPAGYALLLALQETTPAERNADPAVKAAWDYLQCHAPLRPGEAATHFRFWMARDTYQAVSPVQSLIIINKLRKCLTIAGLAYTFFPCSDPGLWEPLFAYAEMRRIPEADFEVGGKRYGVFGNDWRTLSPTAWLALLAEKEVAEGRPVSVPKSETLLVLSEPEFAAALREALRNYTQPALLRINPLLRSKLVAERAGANAPLPEKIAILQMLLRDAAESLESSQRAARGYRAVLHTYLKPASSQEQAADLLDLPFSTYRRHLAEGIGQITEILWQGEIGGWAK